MPETIHAIVCHKTDTAANFQIADPLLYKGQIVAVMDGVKRRLKVGDGANTYNTLPFIDDFLQSYTIDAAVPTTNPGAPNGGRVWETSTAGTYTFFKDINNASIVVNSGEFVHLVDNGSYYSKVVIPFSTSGLATETEIQNIINLNLSAFNDLGTIADDTRGKDLKSYSVSVANPARHIFDPLMPFDAKRIDAVSANIPFSGPGTISLQLIQVGSSGVVTVLNTITSATNGPGVAVINVSAWRSFPSGTYYVGAKGSGTTSPVTINNTTSIGKAAVDYVGAVIGGYFPNTEVNTWFSLIEERALGKKIGTDQAKKAVKVVSDGYIANDEDSVLLIDGTNDVILSLPAFGEKGKIYTIKFLKSSVSGSVTIDAALGNAMIESSGTLVLASPGDYASLIFDGLNYHKI